MNYSHKSDAFQRRVNYAALCFLRGTSDTRAFDSCFEMFDGSAVVTALVRRAERNPTLYKAIASRWGSIFQQGWLETAAQYAAYPRGTLSTLAKRLREDNARRSQENIDTLLAQQRSA